MIIAIIIAGTVIIGFIAAAFALGRSGGRKKVLNKSYPEPTKPELTLEQSEDLKQSHSQLVNVRMRLGRLKDLEIGRKGISVCDSIEKILQTLKDKPENIETSRQLLNYYIPTLEQVVSRYERIETSGTSTPMIPEKVMTYLDDVDCAMNTMYSGLFDNDKLKVEVDMEAMKLAIKRDGLLDDDDFKIQ